MDSEYREPTFRGVLLTLGATVIVVAGLVLLASWFLQQQGCVPGAAQGGVNECAVESPATDDL
jgi:hypothetical protein